MRDIKPGSRFRPSLALGLWILGSITAAQESEIRPTDDFLIRQCDSASADERDRCLAGLAFRTKDPAVCDAAPAGRCQEYVARAAMKQCAGSHQGGERHLCEMSVLAEYPAPDACAHALDESACILTVASTRREPNLIAERIRDPREMQMVMSAYVAAARDLRGLDYIEDPFMHDMSVANAAFAVGFGADRELGAGYCDRLRGEYGPDHQDIGAETVAALCRSLAATSDNLLAREQSIEQPTQLEQFYDEAMAELQAMAEGVETGALDLAAVDCRGRLSEAAGVYAADWGPLTCTAAGDNLRCLYYSHQKWSLDLSLEGPDTLVGEWNHNGHRGDSRTGPAEFSLGPQCQLSGGFYGYGEDADKPWKVEGKK